MKRTILNIIVFIITITIGYSQNINQKASIDNFNQEALNKAVAIELSKSAGLEDTVDYEMKHLWRLKTVNDAFLKHDLIDRLQLRRIKDYNDISKKITKNINYGFVYPFYKKGLKPEFINNKTYKELGKMVDLKYKKSEKMDSTIRPYTEPYEIFQDSCTGFFGFRRITIDKIIVYFNLEKENCTRRNKDCVNMFITMWIISNREKGKNYDIKNIEKHKKEFLNFWPRTNFVEHCKSKF